MDDGGDASPDRYGGVGGGSFHLACYSCGEAAEYSPDDFAENGYFSCSRCGAEHTDTPQTAAEFDINGPGRITRPRPRPAPHPIPPQDEPAADAFSESDEPRDFASCCEPEELGARVRRRYVQGLQVILQRQLESLVETFQVGALVCGVAGTVWVRWVAASKVFDETWARKVLTEDEARRSAAAGVSHKLQRLHLVQLLPLKRHTKNIYVTFMCR
jgi:hypothetical protein